MNLINLKNEVEAAKELLIQAEDNYKKGILEAAQNGELEQRKTAMWKEVYNAAESKTKFYCDSCGFYAPLQSDYCPKCGARMCNPQHYAPKQAAAWVGERTTEQGHEQEPEVQEKQNPLMPDEWMRCSDKDKREEVANLCNKLSELRGGMKHASRSLGKSDRYLHTIIGQMKMSGRVPRYKLYTELARAVYEC